MSLNEYRPHIEEEAAPKKKCMIDLNTQDVLLACNKLLSIQLEHSQKCWMQGKWCNSQQMQLVISMSNIMKAGHASLQVWCYQKNK